MFNNYKARIKGKKGFLALQTIGETILSSIALIILFGIFLNFIFTNTENEDIAEQNAKSIVEFIEFSSSGEYKRFNNCYTKLRLNNLQNFQFEEEKDEESNNFFYVIDSKGIYVLKNKYENEAKNTGNFNYENEKYYFQELKNNNIDIYLDKTDDGNQIASWFGFGEPNKNLNLDQKLEYIMLFPELDDKNNFLEFGYLSKGTGRNVPRIVKEKAFSLVYNNHNNQLFVTTNQQSEIIVKNNLCAKKYLQKTDRNKEILKNNGRNIDFINYDVSFKIYNLDSKKYLAQHFLWSGGSSCFENEEEINCQVYFGEEYDQNYIGYNDFISNIEDFISYEQSKDFDNVKLELEIFEKELTLEEVKDRTNLVDLIEIDHKDFFRIGYDISRLSEKEMVDENIFDISGAFSNEMINGCDKDECNYLQYEDSNVVYFIREEAGAFLYSSFKEEFLKKGKYNTEEEYHELYFNGEKLEYIGKLDADSKENKWWKIWESDNEEFFWYKINNYDQEVDVLLSKNQIERGIFDVYYGGSSK